MINVLVVEDDTNLNQIVCATLNKNGYHAIGCKNPSEAYNLMYGAMYDVIISDIMMPGIDGFEFAETVRQQNKDIPIMFMTARDDISSKQKGYHIGIDDYIVKPIVMEELPLRIGALLRRANIANQKKLEIGSLLIDLDEFAVYLEGEMIPLSVREFNILYKLLSYPKKAFTRSQLMDEFWGLESETGLRTVDVYIARLREKFATCKDFEIVSIRGLGYKVIML